MSQVVPMLDSGVIGAVGGEEARGAYAELQSFPGVPFSRDEASVGVPLLGFRIVDLSIKVGVANTNNVVVSFHRLLDAGEHRWHSGARDDETIVS